MGIRLLPRRLTLAGRRLESARTESGIRGLIAEVFRLAGRLPARFGAYVTESFFDRRRGILTRGLHLNESDLTPISAGGDPEPYQAVSLAQWRRLHSTMDIDRSQYTFVDLGAGLGRGLILAAEMGFGRVVGVELDQRLVSDAEENVRRWRSRRRPGSTTAQVEVVAGDAAAFALPEGPLVVLLYNPFGPTTMREILAQLADRAQHALSPVFVAYVNPQHEQLFAEFPGFEAHSRGKGWSVYRLHQPQTADMAAALS